MSARSSPPNGRFIRASYSPMILSGMPVRRHSQRNSNRNEPQQGREYHPQVYFTGQVSQLKGNWGFIKPDYPIGHDAYKRRKEGVIFFHMNDVNCDADAISEGTKVVFYLYVDDRGLGAHRVTAPEAQSLQGLKILLSVEKSYVGNLIGKKGSTISGLCDKTGAKIQMQNRDEVDPHAPHRICIITGKPPNMIDACYSVADCIATAAQSLNAKIKFLVPPRCMGRLIGKRGANIKELQSKFPSIKADSDRSNEPSFYYDNQEYRGFTCFGPNDDMKSFIEKICYDILAHDGYERPAQDQKQQFEQEFQHDNNDNAPGTSYHESIEIC